MVVAVDLLDPALKDLETAMIASPVSRPSELGDDMEVELDRSISAEVAWGASERSNSDHRR